MSEADSTVSPMLATLGSAADIDETTDDWAFEMKWDGIRAVATVRDGAITLATRNGKDTTATYPELSELGSRTNQHEVVVDGEIVALNKHGRPDFGLLQQRMGLTRKSDVKPSARKVPVQYLVFDILSIDGRSTIDDSYDDRRSVLEKTVQPAAHIQVPDVFQGDLAAAFASSAKLGLEGVMAKRRDSAYSIGRRSRAWVKIKHRKTQEVVIAGWRPGNGRRAEGIGSLLMGVPDAIGLRYVGRVGTGFRDRDLNDIAERLRPLARATSPLHDVPSADARDAHWVTPTLIGEVEFAEWTRDDRLRQPSWRGWRPDKDADQVQREIPPPWHRS
ncbi:MAG TPA: non-homologous end-joining DNA ligase [Galbitalea sp.]|jgi:bifunctional non-homologous end joining protein LigD|nr:non-homologous end-joining DNA ligase [Galbitalea sp.]